MKYIAPYGVSDPNAPYINGDPSIGRQGSIPSAECFEHPLREIVGVIEKSKFTPSGEDLLQLVKSVRSQRINFCDDTGSVNALSVALDPPLTAYTVGLLLRVRVRISNTSSVTLDAGVGTVPVRHMDGSVCNPGDLPAGGVAEVVYDGTVWQLVNFLGEGGAGAPSEFRINIPYCVDTSTTPNLIVAPFSPAITEVTAGDSILVKIANTTTGPTTINVNALPNKSVKARGTGGAMEITQGDMLAGDVILFHYDGTVWQMVPSTVISINTTINVPSQLATVAAALGAIARKTIAKDATVTIKLAQGSFPPFQIYHAYADRIVVDGTMKVLGIIPPNAFAATGNTAGARATDNATNLAMMRSRFGTEINMPGGYNGNGIENIGPGRPTVSNMLIVGQGGGGNPGYDQNGCMAGFGRQLNCYNIGTCYLRTGFGQGGQFFCTSCYAIGSWSYGFLMSGPGSLQTEGCVANSNLAGGIFTNQNGLFSCGQTYAVCNGGTGMEVNDNSYGSCQNCTVLSNGVVDMMSNKLSLFIAFSTSAATSSPSSDVLGNMGSYFLMR